MKKGISLIVLVITIIILIILTATAVMNVTGNGILGKAQNAVDETSKTKFKEQLILAIGEARIDDVGDLNVDTLEDILTSDSYKMTVTKTNGTFPITVTNILGEVLRVDAAGRIIEKMKDLIVEKPTGENGKFAVGQEITFEGEKFFVVSDDGTTLKILAKYCLLRDASAQVDKDVRYNGYGRTFSSTNYWEEDFTSSPFDLQGEYLEEHPLPISETVSNNAIKAAQAYGEIKGVTGRLMTYSEAQALISSNSAIMYGRWTDGTQPTQGYVYWWIGTAINSSSVWFVDGCYDLLSNYGSVDYDNYSRTYGGVRPVLEIK